MTLPDEVVKEIAANAWAHAGTKAVWVDVVRDLCLLTRRLTIEECAKKCEGIDDRGEWGESAGVCATAIRSLLKGTQ